MNCGKVKIPGLLFFLLCLSLNTTAAQSPVAVMVDTRSGGQVIPDDFCGLSFGAVAELPRHDTGLLFSPTNSQLIALFTNSGIRNLRLGGSTVEGIHAARPSHEAIDEVFGFAKAAGIRVIYSLPLLNGNPAEDADTARYIWDRYRPWLECFAIGNEPDIRRYHYPPFGTGTDPRITNFMTFMAQWKIFAAAVTNAVPGAVFAGPDAANTGKDGEGWAARFVADEKNSGIVVLATQHFYVGGSPFTVPNDDHSKLIPVSNAIDKMLSPDYDSKRYPSIYGDTLLPVVNEGVPYRMTESDDCLKGVPNASDAFASALWGLDYLHWWAAHGARGVNFHNTEWLKTDTVYFDSASQSYKINPKAYAIRAFDLGSQGAEEPVTIKNGDKLNLTAYAVCNTTNLYVTIINKEHGERARAAAVRIAPEGFSPGEVETMFLQAPQGDVGARDGITLGGAVISHDNAWRGKWTLLEGAKSGIVVNVPAGSAAIIEIHRSNAG